MTVILLPSAIDPPGSAAWPARSAMVVWVLVALIITHSAVSQLVGWSTAWRWGVIDEQVFRAVTYATTVWSLYPDPALFAPWQLWTYVLIHDSWIQLGIDLFILVLAGRAVERWIGGAAFAGAVITLAPLAAVIHLLAEHDSAVLTGADGVAMGTMGMAIALFPRTRVRWGIAYFAIIVIGYRPLFRLALPWLALLCLAALMALHPRQLLPTAIADTSALVAGILLGFAGRRVRNPPAERDP